MDKLYNLIKTFRNAIDGAKARREFNSSSCLFKFPNGCCDTTCDLLGEYLREYGIHTFQINGRHKYDFQWRHVWLNTSDGTVIDITGDQFAGKPGFSDYLPTVWVGDENEVHKIFCIDKKREDNTVFVDPTTFDDFGGILNFRQKRLIDAYRIIKKYLRELN